MNINDKLDNINNTKQEIKSAIESKGQSVGDIPFAQYTDKIMAIEIGEGSEGGGDLGSHSSDEVIENYTNEYKSQVNVSENSSATAVGLVINISESEVERWEPVNMRQIYGDLETEWLVDGTFIYAEVMDYGDFLNILVGRKESGPDMGMELYPVKIMSAPSQVNASSNSEASGFMSQVNASEFSTASRDNSQINASRNSYAAGPNSQVNASQGSHAVGYTSQVNASDNSRSFGRTSQVNSSRYIVNDVEGSSAWGWGYAEPPNPPNISTANIKIHLLSQSGDINHSGVLNSGHNFTDFAELFPNATGEAQGYGLIQTIDGHGVRPANEGDQAVGVTSATAGVVLGETPFSWADRWLKDEWGALIYHDVLDNDWEPDKSKGETEDDRPTITIPKENPDYDPEQEQIKRQDRPDEWTVVGLVGQVYVRLNESVEPMDYVKPDKDGVGQTSDEPTSIRVMKVTQEFDENKGYKIGFCLLK